MSDASPPPVSDIGSPNSDDKLWAVLSHVSFFVFAIFGPLIIWLVKKDSSPFVAHHAKEALNFQLAAFIVVLLTSATCVGAPIAVIAWVGGIVYSIIAAMECNKGVLYNYPYTFRLIS